MNINEKLAKLIESDKRHYDELLAKVDSQQLNLSHSSQIIWHYVKLDGDLNPRIEELARRIVKQITSFVIPPDKRANQDDPQPSVTDWMNARDTFNLKEKSGEPGEVLLFFLLELVTQAPQLICKMDLKTNSADETKGSDGIHIGWCEQRKRFKLYFGEAKLHKDFTGAAYEAIKSIAAYHKSKKQSHDILLVTRHFKHLDAELKRQIIASIDPDKGSKDYISQYAALVGYDCDSYSKIKGTTKQPEELPQLVIDKMKEQAEYISKRIEEENLKDLEFHFFILPLETVQLFRDKFNDALIGKR